MAAIITPLTVCLTGDKRGLEVHPDDEDILIREMGGRDGILRVLCNNQACAEWHREEGNTSRRRCKFAHVRVVNSEEDVLTRKLQYTLNKEKYLEEKNLEEKKIKEKTKSSVKSKHAEIRNSSTLSIMIDLCRNISAEGVKLSKDREAAIKSGNAELNIKSRQESLKYDAARAKFEGELCELILKGMQYFPHIKTNLGEPVEQPVAQPYRDRLIADEFDTHISDVAVDLSACSARSEQEHSHSDIRTPRHVKARLPRGTIFDSWKVYK
jgi:hypothetical protein